MIACHNQIVRHISYIKNAAKEMRPHFLYIGDIQEVVISAI